MDRSMAELRQTFGLAPRTERLPMHLWNFGAPEFPCPDWAGGCTLIPSDELHVRDSRALHHEVVHVAVTSGLDDFYAEGLAETLASTIPPSPEGRFDPRPWFEADNADLNFYGAAIFANFMLERYGPEVTLGAFRAASKHGAAKAFPDWTGDSVDEIVEQFMAEPVYCSSQLDRCGSPGEPVGVAWSHDSRITCSDEAALGVDTGVQELATIEIESEGNYLVELENGAVFIDRCAPCAERDTWALSSDAPAQELELAAGRYRLSMLPVTGFPYHVSITKME
jgi:hypothetical protein